MKTRTKIATTTLAALAIGWALTGAACTSDADKASENIATAAEQFEVQRTIVGVSGITGKTLFYAEGRCSFEVGNNAHRVDVTCKYGPNEFRKTTWLKGDQDSVAIVQEKPIDVSVYHTRIIIKPENLLPEFDLQVGKQ